MIVKLNGYIFFIESDELLKNIMIFEAKSEIVFQKTDSEPIYNKKFWETKIKSAETTDFHDKEMPKVGSNCICVALILIDFALKKDEKCYPELFLKE